MRALLLADANSPHVQTWVRGLAPHLSRVLVYSFARPAGDWYRALENVEVASLGVSARSIGRSSFDPRKLRYLLARREIERLAERFAPDLVHAHFASSYGLAGARVGRHPLVVSVWGSDVFRFPRTSWLHRRWLTRVLATADGILATSRASAEALRAYTKKDVTVLPFGVDVDRFAPRSLGREPKDVLTVGAVKHLERDYGIDVLIRAFARLHRDREGTLRLVVAGEGSERKRCRALVTSLGLDGVVELVGRIEHASVPDFLARCDVIANPSRFESFGVSVLEAGAAGLPVVATRVGGLPEIVEHEKTGLLVPSDDEVALAGALARLLDDEELRNRLGAEARKRIASRYDFGRLAREAASYYRAVATRSQS